MDSEGNGLNWAALLPVALGGVLLLVAWEGTHRKLWAAITGQPQTTSNFTPPSPMFPIGSSSSQSTSSGCSCPAGCEVGTGATTLPNGRCSVCNNIGSSSPCGSKTGDYRSVASKDALLAGINPTYFVKQIQQESGFSPTAQSSAGAEGIAQFMPGTAKGLGVDPWDPVASLKAAANLMAGYVKNFGGGLVGENKALAAYNAGSGAVNTAVYQASTATRGGSRDWYNYLPSETQNYIKAITGSTS